MILWPRIFDSAVAVNGLTGLKQGKITERRISPSEEGVHTFTHHEVCYGVRYLFSNVRVGYKQPRV